MVLKAFCPPWFWGPILVVAASKEAVESAALILLAFGPKTAAAAGVVVVAFDDIFAKYEAETGAMRGGGVGVGAHFLVRSEKVL